MLFFESLVRFCPTMKKLYLLLPILFLIYWGCEYSTGQNNELGSHSFDYLLEDINSSSQSYGNEVGPSYFKGQITLNYFGHFSWGTCAARFGQLNDIVNDLKSQNYPVELVGIGKESHITSLGNWTSNNNASVCSDQSPFPTWTSWAASQRELYVLDQSNELVMQQNVTNGLPDNLSDLIKSLVTPATMPWILGNIYVVEIHTLIKLLFRNLVRFGNV